MKKIFQKLLQKFIKKAVNKAVSSEVPEVEPIVDAEPDVVLNTQESAIKTKTPWWVILLKILSYIISLILGGVVTSCAPHIL
jgi:hypothetical protein